MNRLPNFPIPLKNEAFQSVIARHLARSAGSKARNLKILGLQKGAATCVAPNNINHIASIAPIGHPWADAPSLIIQKHTLVPLFLQFAHPEWYEKTIQTISQGETKNPGATLGLTNPSGRLLLQGDFKYCSKCLSIDLDNFGFPVFYRQHQPWFVKFCAIHEHPLQLFCTSCAEFRKGSKVWRMPNDCHCAPRNCPPVIPHDLPSHAEESFLWVSKRVDDLLSSDSNEDSTLATELVSELRKRNLITSANRFRSIKSTPDLTTIYGQEFLEYLGATSWSRKINLLLSPEQTPNFLKCLLISKILDATPPPSHSPQNSQSNIVPATCKASTPSSKELTLAALVNSKWHIDPAAQELGVSRSTLVSHIRHHRIRVPLSRLTTKRLTPRRVEDIRLAIRKGIALYEIRKSFNITAWSLDLILMDDPTLIDAHKAAIKSNKIEFYRTALIQFREDNPYASRSDARDFSESAVNWLCEVDKNWLNEFFPCKKMDYSQRVRTRRTDIDLLDESLVLVIRKEASKEINKTGRSIRIAYTRLLKAAGITAILGQDQDSPRCKKAYAEAIKLSESKHQFHARLIRWSLQQYSALQIPISNNRLRRIAGLSAGEMLEHKELIIKFSEELGLEFHGRCNLSPNHGEPIKS